MLPSHRPSHNMSSHFKASRSLSAVQSAKIVSHNVISWEWHLITLSCSVGYKQVIGSSRSQGDYTRCDSLGHLRIHRVSCFYPSQFLRSQPLEQDSWHDHWKRAILFLVVCVLPCQSHAPLHTPDVTCRQSSKMPLLCELASRESQKCQ